MSAGLRAPVDEIGSEEDRMKRDRITKANQRRLLELNREEASKFLALGQPELAVPRALESLQLSIAVFGEGHVDLVPAYLLLAEATLGLGRVAQVEEFLSMALWSVMKNPSCSNGLRSKLHRTFGRMYLAGGKCNDALQSLAQDAYYCSLDVGPDSTATAGAYFYMGAAFLAQGNQECALAMYDKVVDSWYKHLGAVKSSGGDEIASLSDAAAAESASVLTTIVDVRDRLLGSNHIATGEALYTLGLFKLMRRDDLGARNALSSAHSVYQAVLGHDHPSTRDVVALLESM